MCMCAWIMSTLFLLHHPTRASSPYAPLVSTPPQPILSQNNGLSGLFADESEMFSLESMGEGSTPGNAARLPKRRR